MQQASPINSIQLRTRCKHSRGQATITQWAFATRRSASNSTVHLCIEDMNYYAQTDESSAGGVCHTHDQPPGNGSHMFFLAHTISGVEVANDSMRIYKRFSLSRDSLRPCAITSYPLFVLQSVGRVDRPSPNM